MGRYRARDLWTLPSLVSLVRVPLAVAFLLVESPVIGFAILVVAGVSDVVDGWLARRFDQASATGAAVDPVTDKLFVGAVLGTLVLRGQLEPEGILLLSVREIGELPLVVWLAVSVRARQRQAEHPRANLPGKLATILQFGSIAAALFHLPQLGVLLWATAGAGMVAAATYWQRALRGRKEGS